MLLRLLCYISLCAVPICLHAEGLTSSQIASVDAGLICPPHDMEKAPAPDTLAGTTHVIDVEPPFAAVTQRVPAVLGIGFGVKALASASEGIAGVTMLVTHPPMGPSGITSQSFQTSISGVAPSLTFYQFDHSYELVRGTWTLTALSGNDPLYSVAFEVVDPEALPRYAGLCHYEDLLS